MSSLLTSFALSDCEVASVPRRISIQFCGIVIAWLSKPASCCYVCEVASVPQFCLAFNTYVCNGSVLLFVCITIQCAFVCEVPLRSLLKPSPLAFVSIVDVQNVLHNAATEMFECVR